MIEAPLAALHDSPVDETLVVLGADPGNLRAICTKWGARPVENPDWRQGQSTSVRAGLEACGRETRAAVVLLGDQPFVDEEAVERLVDTFRRGAKVAIATYGGKRRNPVLFSREVWSLLLHELSGDEGARSIIRKHPELVTEVPCEDVADPADVDTLEDLRRLEEISRKM